MTVPVDASQPPDRLRRSFLASLLLTGLWLVADTVWLWQPDYEFRVRSPFHLLATPVTLLVTMLWAWYTARRLSTEGGRRGWLWLATGLTLLFPATCVWSWHLFQEGRVLVEAQFISLTALGILLITLGIFRLPNGVRSREELVRLALDVGIALTLAGTAILFYVIWPVLYQPGNRDFLTFLLVGPISALLQIFVLVMLLGLQRQQPQRKVTFWLALAAFALLCVNAAFFARFGTLAQEQIASPLVQLYFLLFIPAAYQQLRTVGEPGVERTSLDQLRSRRWLPLFTLLLVLGIAWNQIATGYIPARENIPSLIAFTVLVVLLVGRQFLGAREAEQLQHQLLRLNENLEVEVARQTAFLRTANEELAQHRDHLTHMVQKRTQELEDKNQELIEAHELRSQFLANTSHELRTPLSAIMGYIDMMLMSGKADDKQRETLERMQRNAQRLLTQINELLDLSIIQSQQLRFHPQPVHLALLLEESIFETHVEAQRRGLEFRMELQPSLPDVVENDPQRLFQILSHLLANALKFTRQGHVILRAWGEGSSWVLEVEDTGIGIEPQMREFIWDEFRQGNGSYRTRELMGVGLGLAIVRRLCEMMGGTVAVESSPGVGSIFRATLPVTLPDRLKEKFVEPVEAI